MVTTAEWPWYGNPWGTPKYSRQTCPTCKGTGVTVLKIEDAVELLIHDDHWASRYHGREDEFRERWRKRAEEKSRTYQRVVCPDCRHEENGLRDGALPRRGIEVLSLRFIVTAGLLLGLTFVMKMAGVI